MNSNSAKADITQLTSINTVFHPQYAFCYRELICIQVAVDFVVIKSARLKSEIKQNHNRDSPRSLIRRINIARVGTKDLLKTPGNYAAIIQIWV